VSVSLDDLKAHLNITSGTNDDELLDMLDAATGVVEGLVGPITSGTVTETHYRVRSDALVLQQMPVGSLSSISYRVGNVETGLLVGDFLLDPATGIVRSAYGYHFCGDYTVTYTVGESLPAAVRQALLIIAAHLWETQRGAAPVGPLAADDGALTPGLGYAIPNRARELLVPYTQITLA
jgi:uncharacterized phiE125 gp8 family phage protein